MTIVVVATMTADAMMIVTTTVAVTIVIVVGTAIAEGMRMYGLTGGCEEFGGKGATDFYHAALAIVPNNTLALTHVAYGDRAPCSARA